MVDNCQHDLQINRRKMKYEHTIIYLRNVEKNRLINDYRTSKITKSVYTVELDELESFHG